MRTYSYLGMVDNQQQTEVSAFKKCNATVGKAPTTSRTVRAGTGNGNFPFFTRYPVAVRQVMCFYDCEQKDYHRPRGGTEARLPELVVAIPQTIVASLALPLVRLWVWVPLLLLLLLHIAYWNRAEKAMIEIDCGERLFAGAEVAKLNYD